jgi:CBS domain-containing protein
MLLVRHLLQNRPSPHVLSSEITVLEAARFLRAKKIGGAPVVDHGRLVGFCSERDLVVRVLAEGRDPDTTRIEDVMTRDVVTAELDDELHLCEEKIRRRHCRHLPIVENERVVGCLSMRDFLQSELDEKSAEVEQLANYVRSAGQ